MAVFPERRVSSAASWSWRLAIFSAVLLLTSSIGHRINAVDTIAFFWLLILIAALAVAALLLAALGFFRLWEFGDKGGRNSTKAALLAMLVLAPFGYAVSLFLTLPMLTDLSTDLVDPPAFSYARNLRNGQMNPIAPISGEQAKAQIAFYPEITGRRYPIPMELMREILGAALKNLGWSSPWPERPSSSGVAVTIETIAKSPWIGLVSDAAIRLTDEGGTVYVDIRAASRYGNHDFGDNAAKIRSFFDALEAEIAARNVLTVAPAN